MIIAPDDPGQNALSQMIDAEVTKVFDGDGFLAKIWHPRRRCWLEKIPFRFAFIDAPEMGQPFGSEAQSFLQELVGGNSLRLDPIGKGAEAYNPIDEHKRMLCMGYLTEEMPVGLVHYYLNGTCSSGLARKPRMVTRNIELEMLVNGFAWVLPQYAFEEKERYLEAQENARQGRRGLWKFDDPELPWRFKQRQKAQRRKEAEHRDQLGLFSRACGAEGCDGQLVERQGVRGLFLGCTNFPSCRFSRAHKE